MRRAFLFLAAGLLASVAVSARRRPAWFCIRSIQRLSSPRAAPEGAVLVFSENLTAPVTVTSTTIPGGAVGVVTPPTPSNTITFTFADTGPGTYTLNFTVFGPSSPPLLGLGGTISGTGGTQGGAAILSITSVPEPASLALLGIGMTGFLAFRRFFKKTAVA